MATNKPHLIRSMARAVKIMLNPVILTNASLLYKMDLQHLEDTLINHEQDTEVLILACAMAQDNHQDDKARLLEMYLDHNIKTEAANNAT